MSLPQSPTAQNNFETTIMLAVTTTPYTVRPIPLTAPRLKSHLGPTAATSYIPSLGCLMSAFFLAAPSWRDSRVGIWFMARLISHTTGFSSDQFGWAQLDWLFLSLSRLLLLLLCIHKFRLGCRFRNGFQTLFQFHFGLLRYGFIVLIVSGMCVDLFDVPATYFKMFYVRYKNMNWSIDMMLTDL